MYGTIITKAALGMWLSCLTIGLFGTDIFVHTIPQERHSLKWPSKTNCIPCLGEECGLFTLPHRLHLIVNDVNILVSFQVSKVLFSELNTLFNSNIHYIILFLKCQLLLYNR